jgi:chromosome segregation ATPase
VIRIVAVMLLVAGCSVVSQIGGGRRGDEAAMSEADALSAAGRYTEAAAAYSRVVHSGVTDEVRARALFELARLANEPRNPARDERRASEHLERLRRDYPRTPWAEYARAWQDMLGELQRARDHSARAEQEIVTLRQQVHELSAEVRRTREAVRELERLRQRLAEAERDAASLRDDLQRLKVLELELEQRQRPR